MTEQTTDPWTDPHTVTTTTLPATIEEYEGKPRAGWADPGTPASKLVIIDLTDLVFADERRQWEFNGVINAEGTEVTLLMHPWEYDD